MARPATSTLLAALVLALAACGPLLGGIEDDGGASVSSASPGGDGGDLDDGGEESGYPPPGGYGDSGGYPAPGDTDPDEGTPVADAAFGVGGATDATVGGPLGALGVGPLLGDGSASPTVSP